MHREVESLGWSSYEPFRIHCALGYSYVCMGSFMTASIGSVLEAIRTIWESSPRCFWSRAARC